MTDTELDMLEVHARNALLVSPQNVDALDKLALVEEVRRLCRIIVGICDVVQCIEHKLALLDLDPTSPRH